jgi:hypothetical protein
MYIQSKENHGTCFSFFLFNDSNDNKHFKKDSINNSNFSKVLDEIKEIERDSINIYDWDKNLS